MRGSQQSPATALECLDCKCEPLSPAAENLCFTLLTSLSTFQGVLCFEGDYLHNFGQFALSWSRIFNCIFAKEGNIFPRSEASEYGFFRTIFLPAMPFTSIHFFSSLFCHLYTLCVNKYFPFVPQLRSQSAKLHEV